MNKGDMKGQRCVWEGVTGESLVVRAVPTAPENQKKPQHREIWKRTKFPERDI